MTGGLVTCWFEACAGVTVRESFGFLAWVEVAMMSVDTAREASLVENMRVKRSLTVGFSAGFGSCSPEPSGTGVPLDVGARLGDRFDASTEWIDDGCEFAREDGALEIGVLVILKRR